MIDSLRKQHLEDAFLMDALSPDGVTQEDAEYIDTLTKQWNDVLLNLYGQIMQAGRESNHAIE